MGLFGFERVYINTWNVTYFISSAIPVKKNIYLNFYGVFQVNKLTEAEMNFLKASGTISFHVYRNNFSLISLYFVPFKGFKMWSEYEVRFKKKFKGNNSVFGILDLGVINNPDCI